MEISNFPLSEVIAGVNFVGLDSLLHGVLVPGSLFVEELGGEFSPLTHVSDPGAHSGLFAPVSHVSDTGAHRGLFAPASHRTEAYPHPNRFSTSGVFAFRRDGTGSGGFVQALTFNAVGVIGGVIVSWGSGVWDWVGLLHQPWGGGASLNLVKFLSNGGVSQSNPAVTLNGADELGFGSDLNESGKYYRGFVVLRVGVV